MAVTLTQDDRWSGPNRWLLRARTMDMWFRPGSALRCFSAASAFLASSALKGFVRPDTGRGSLKNSICF